MIEPNTYLTTRHVCEDRWPDRCGESLTTGAIDETADGEIEHHHSWWHVCVAEGEHPEHSCSCGYRWPNRPIRLPFAMIDGPEIEELRGLPEALRAVVAHLHSDDDDLLWIDEAAHERWAEILQKVIDTYGAPMEPVDPEELE